MDTQVITVLEYTEKEHKEKSLLILRKQPVVKKSYFFTSLEQEGVSG